VNLVSAHPSAPSHANINKHKESLQARKRARKKEASTRGGYMQHVPLPHHPEQMDIENTTHTRQKRIMIRTRETEDKSERMGHGERGKMTRNETTRS